MATISRWFRKNSINLMYVPALVLFIVFVVYPFIDGIRISFTNWNGYSQSYKYVGLDNYKRLFEADFVRIAFVNTLIYGIGSTVFQNIIGLAYALFLNKPHRGRSIVRTIIYIPVMVAPLIMGYVFYFFFQFDGGALNDVMSLFGKVPVDWLATPSGGVVIITMINVLQYCGIAMILYLAGLQSIPEMYFEAAELDGAGRWAMFKHVTLPLLMPAIKSSVILNIIGGLKLFDIIMSLTSGGPGYATHSLSTLVTNAYFRMQHAGFSATIGIFTFVFIMVVSLICMKFFDKRGVEY
ncbi:MAG: carbohydrate ABC transporter permease [Cellulosilyticaceae bacterium]